jgi:hypothetical protein
MSRTIKFRVWHTPMKKMYQVEGLFPDRVRTVEPVDEDGNICLWSDYVIMQCTGLLDRTGKEIYEGDILQVYPVRHRPMVVFWHDKLAQFDYLVESAEPRAFGPLCKYWETEPEGLPVVIGNIYANPELVQ